MFELLAKQIVPELVVRARSGNHPVRIWVAGCSTGEEAYSLVMLFREEITASNLDVKLQVFASDVDPDAVAAAPGRIISRNDRGRGLGGTAVSLFFEGRPRISSFARLRSVVVFTVQDLLADPPFSRLDLVSCRNVLIYLRPEAQARVLSLFHFALREDGILLLGSSETAGDVKGRFDVISKPARLYRHVGRARAGELGFLMAAGEGAKSPPRAGQGRPASREVALAELCRRLVLEAYAPAAVLINRNNECLYSLGPIDQCLRVAPGPPTRDLLAMTPQGQRTKLRAAIHEATQNNARVVVAGAGGAKSDGRRFSIAVQPVVSDGEALLLICFVDEPKPAQRPNLPVAPGDRSKIAELEQELAATRAELDGAIRNLEISNEEQRTANEEALSVNEEFQSTNEELLTSKRNCSR